MKKLLVILILLQVTASAQTLRFLGYFSPTNEIVTPTNWVSHSGSIRNFTNATQAIFSGTMTKGGVTVPNINNATWFSGGSATETWTFSLSGATDPVITFGNGVVNVTTGTLQQGGTAVTLQDRTITVAGTANEITSSAGAQDLSANRTWTLSLPATIDLGGKTSFELPNAAAPTTDAFGEIAGDNNAWAASRGAIQAFDGTANTWLVGVLSSDTPSNGQVPTWNTGGTITWETPTGGGGSAPVGTMVNSGASTQYAIPYYTDTTGTNLAPSLLLTDATLTNFYAGNFFIDTLIITNDVELAGDFFIGGAVQITNGPITLGLAGVRLSHDSDGAWTWLGLGNGSDEDLTWNLDDTADAVVVSSSTGVGSIRFTGIGLLPSANDGAALGSSSLSWSDLFLASTAVINFGAGNVTITHAAGAITVAGASTFSLGTSAAFTTGTIELGHASENTLSASGGVLSIEGVALQTASSTADFTNKGYDASGTGNTLKQLKQLNLQRPDYGDGTGAVPQTNTFNASGLMHYTFSGNAETNANWVVYEFDVPSDLDTTVEMTARFAGLSGGTDADDYVFHLTYATQAPGSAYVTGTSISTSPIVMTITPTTAASGDLQQSSAVTLTGWAGALTAGRPMQVRVARLQNAQDDSWRDVQLVITYGSTL